MCRTFFVFSFFILLGCNIVKSQNTNKKDLTQSTSKNDTLLLNHNIKNLSEVELKALQLIDSVMQVEQSEKEHSKLDVLLNKQIVVSFLNISLDKIIDYNNYEGLRLGFGFMSNTKISRHFSLGGYFGYGYKDRDWKYGGDLILKLHEASESQLQFSYSNDVLEKAGYHFFDSPDFSSSEIYRKYMIENMDLMEKYEAAFSLIPFQYLKTRFFYNQSYVTATDGYSYGPALTGATSTFIFNEIGIQFRYAYKEKFLQTTKATYSRGSIYPIFYGNITRGSHLLDGEYEYTKYEARITKNLKTKTWGESHLTFVGGFVDGDVPVSKMYHGHGSYQPFSLEAENSFGTMRMGEFYSDKFLSIFFKHDFGSFLLKSKLFSPGFALVNNFGIGEFSNSSNHQTAKPIQSIDKGYYECGLLINEILQSSFSGIGFGVFYRYGPYSFLKAADNFSYKMSLRIKF